MITNKKWMVYGVAGAVGLSLVGGAAAATAASMNLNTTDGSVVPGGPVVGNSGKSVLGGDGVQLRVSDTSASVVTSASAAAPANPAPQGSTTSVVSAASAVPPPAPAPAPPAPAPAPAAPAPAPAPAPDSGASGGSVGSAWSD